MSKDGRQGRDRHQGEASRCRRPSQRLHKDLAAAQESTPGVPPDSPRSTCTHGTPYPGGSPKRRPRPRHASPFRAPRWVPMLPCRSLRLPEVCLSLEMAESASRTVIFAGENCQKGVCFPGLLSGVDGWSGIKEGKVRLASSDKHGGMKHYFLFLHGAGQSLLTRSNYKHFCTHLCKSWVPSSKTS